MVPGVRAAARRSVPAGPRSRRAAGPAHGRQVCRKQDQTWQVASSGTVAWLWGRFQIWSQRPLAYGTGGVQRPGRPAHQAADPPRRHGHPPPRHTGGRLRGPAPPAGPPSGAGHRPTTTGAPHVSLSRPPSGTPSARTSTSDDLEASGQCTNPTGRWLPIMARARRRCKEPVAPRRARRVRRETGRE